MLEITPDNFEGFIEEPGIKILDFWAPWCKPCIGMEPVVVKLSQSVRVGKINIDKEVELATRFSVKSIPTLIILKDKMVVQRFVGLQPYSIVKEFIDTINISEKE